VVILKYSPAMTVTYSAGVTRTTTTVNGYTVDTITATSTTSETVSWSF
jgi:hypothetical protein